MVSAMPVERPVAAVTKYAIAKSTKVPSARNEMFFLTERESDDGCSGPSLFFSCGSADSPGCSAATRIAG